MRQFEQRENWEWGMIQTGTWYLGFNETKNAKEILNEENEVEGRKNFTRRKFLAFSL